MNVENLTPFAIEAQLSQSRSGEDLLLFIAAGTFDLPPAGKAPEGDLQISEEQKPPPLADVWWGEPAKTSLRYEGQCCFVRPGTDIYLGGSAWAPAGRAVTELDVGLSVGPCTKIARVIGERRWVRGLTGLRSSKPEPFESMPVLYERAFGGSLPPPSEGKPAPAEERNPVGRGYFKSARQAVDQPLPNVEDPRALITSWRQKPAPVGFGPIARFWAPRKSFAGTYDDEWVERRAPRWPDDFDERFFHAASPGLVAPEKLRGGEPVQLRGFSPDGEWRFALPRYRIQLKSRFPKRRVLSAMTLDAVHFEPDEASFTMIWRATVRAHGEVLQHTKTVARVLEPWEDDVRVGDSRVDRRREESPE